MEVYAEAGRKLLAKYGKAPGGPTGLCQSFLIATIMDKPDLPIYWPTRTRPDGSPFVYTAAEGNLEPPPVRLALEIEKEVGFWRASVEVSSRFPKGFGQGKRDMPLEFSLLEGPWVRASSDRFLLVTGAVKPAKFFPSGERVAHVIGIVPERTKGFGIVDSLLPGGFQQGVDRGQVQDRIRNLFDESEHLVYWRGLRASKVQIPHLRFLVDAMGE